jgi:hypothetical protein
MTVTTSTSTTSTGGSSSSYSSATTASLFGSALADFGSGADVVSWSMTILGSGGGVLTGSPDEYLSHCLPSK